MHDGTRNAVIWRELASRWYPKGKKKKKIECERGGRLNLFCLSVVARKTITKTNKRMKRKSDADTGGILS